VEDKTRRILCLNFAKGRVHDFNLYKRSRLPMSSSILARVDTGFVGITEYHSNTAIPVKASKKHKLTADEKARNKELSRLRVINEIVIGRLKIFRILAEKYRGRRRKFSMIFNLIASLYNRKLLGF